jgi:hypothetical protein
MDVRIGGAAITALTSVQNFSEAECNEMMDARPVELSDCWSA